MIDYNSFLIQVGYHSNDTRSSVQDKHHYNLPITVSTELGTLLFHIKTQLSSATVWGMDLSNELVYWR